MYEKEIEELQKIIDDSSRIVFFGGAGVSTESGIPDFRSADGIYHQQYKYSPEQVVSHSFFMQHTEAFYDFYKEKMMILDAKPNPAHYKLAELEQAMQGQGNAAEEAGDLLFAAAGLARVLGVDPEQVLTGASDRYQSRIIRCEELAGSEALAGLSDEERRALWRQAKNEEQSSKV